MINKLKGSRVYLSGPIDYASDNGIGWRRSITPFLESLGVIVIDPTNKPLEEEDDIEHSKLRKECRKNKDYQGLSTLMRNIRVFDLRCTDICDWSIVYLDYDVIMTGTLEEIFCMNRSKKPILIYCKQGIDKISDWLFGCLPYQMFFQDWDQLKTYVSDIDSGKDNNLMKRWIFFDYSRL